MQSVIAILFVLITALSAEDDLPEPPVSWKYPPEMPGASVEVYRDIHGVRLNAYVFTPPGHRASDRRPAVLFFFGGGWKGGSPGQFLPQSLHLSQRGMVAIACDYRVLGRHGVLPQDCLRDAKAAVRWARAKAATLGIDPDRIVAGGESAGGHLAAAVALALLRCGRARQSSLVLAATALVVGLSGVVVLMMEMPCASPAPAVASSAKAAPMPP